MADKAQTDYFKLGWEKLTKAKSKGYLYFYMPSHPLAQQNGMVAAHRHVMSVYLERWLQKGEVVAFRNGERDDVRLENLELKDNAALLAVNAGYTEANASIEKLCARCGKPFTIPPSVAAKRKHCSPRCAQLSSRRLKLTKEELERLVWEMPTTHIAAEQGVSDKAIEKWCKKWGISKPSRGYWARLYAGQIDPVVERNGRQD